MYIVSAGTSFDLSNFQKECYKLAQESKRGNEDSDRPYLQLNPAGLNVAGVYLW